MKKLYYLLSGLLLMAVSSTVTMAETMGIVTRKSNHPVSVTIERLKDALSDKGMTIFAHIDHGKGAKAAGLLLRPTELLIFGNPRVGTPLMDCKQSIALDLPQKVLVYEDSHKDVWLLYNDPYFIARRHAMTGCERSLKKVATALERFADQATR